MNYRYKDFIVINPLMRGGMVPKDVSRTLIEEGWMDVGYTICHDCIEGQSGLITKPNIKSFLQEVANFFGGDAAHHTFGCRASQFAVMKTIADAGNKNKVVIADSNSHYTTHIAAEMAGLKVTEVPHTGHPEHRIEAEKVLEKIEEVKNPALVFMTHADPYHGNLAPVEEVGKICAERGIPYVVNAAYTGGVKPIDMKSFKADFLTLSAHKSMSSIGPLGFIVTDSEWSEKVFAKSKTRTDWAGKTFVKKIPNIFGCSIGAVPLVSAMMSFPHVKKRVKKWDEELKRTEKFVEYMENLGDIKLLGERPKGHHLLHFETPLFWEISKTHKRKGFFLAEEIIKRGIVGIQKGLSKHIKMSVYGLPDQDIKKVEDAFEEISKL